MLRDYIEKKNLSVYRVAKESGVPYTTVNELVLGKKQIRDCSVKTVVNLSRFFGLGMDDFLRVLDIGSDEKEDLFCMESVTVYKTGSRVEAGPANFANGYSGRLRKMNPRSLATTWEDARKKKYRFPIVKNMPASEAEPVLFDLSRIHPLKQLSILKLVRGLSANDFIESAVLFGSSTTIRCGKDSDIDIAVKLKDGTETKETKNDISERIQNLTGYNADIIWMDRVAPDSPLAKNIERGVRIL